MNRLKHISIEIEIDIYANIFGIFCSWLFVNILAFVKTKNAWINFKITQILIRYYFKIKTVQIILSLANILNTFIRF